MPKTEEPEVTETVDTAEVEADHPAARMGRDLVHIETELNAHGLSIGSLLRTVARQTAGVTISPLPEKE